MLLLRNQAEELGCVLSKGEAAHYLAQATGRNVGIPEPKQGGQKLDVSPVPWLWEGVIMRGRQNLVVAPPKVGKSALMTAMAAAALRGVHCRWPRCRPRGRCAHRRERGRSTLGDP